VSVVYGEEPFGSVVFGQAIQETTHDILYRILTVQEKEFIVGYRWGTVPVAFYGEDVFGNFVFGARSITENERKHNILYRFVAIRSKEFNTPYHWGIGIEGDKVVPYRYKALIPKMGDINYRFVSLVSDEFPILYRLTHPTSKEAIILYAYRGHTSKVFPIRYGYRSLEALFKGTVRKITISATPRGQIARIELERR